MFNKFVVVFSAFWFVFNEFVVVSIEFEFALNQFVVVFSEFEFALKNLLLCFAEMGHRTTSLGSSVGSKQGPRSLSAVERLGESETRFHRVVRQITVGNSIFC